MQPDMAGKTLTAAQEEDLIALFNTAVHEPQLAGSVEAVRLVRNPTTNAGKGIGYVLFKGRTAALAALNLNGVECKGRKLRVQRVKASAGGTNAVKVEPKTKGRPAGGAVKRVAGKVKGIQVNGDAAGALLRFNNVQIIHGT